VRVKHLTSKDLLVPALLTLLSLVPILGGIARSNSLGESGVTAENARFFASPWPIAIHAAAAGVYSLLGAFQFSSALRLRFPRWHRRAGKVLVLCGIAVAVTGVWMTLRYPIPSSMQGPLLYVTRLLVGSYPLLALLLGWRRVSQRDFRAHEAWMIRAYAVAQGAGTQAVIIGPWILISGEVLYFTRDVLMLVSWGINWLVAEWIIRSRAPAVHGPAPAVKRVSSFG
jgi:uncharacterized membrane protein